MKLNTLSYALILFVVAGCLVPSVQAQESKEIPKPEVMSVETKDGVSIKCTYFGSNKGKNAVPIILLHGWEGKRANMVGLAKKIQESGHAVIIPDLRGHGDSKSVTLPNGQVKEIKLDRIRAANFATYVTQDMEAVKRFLMTENNAGKLNIEMLTIIGCDFSTIVAVNWAVQDWSWPVLAGSKQGQDVKALVLVSPDPSFKGFSYAKALQTPAMSSFLSIMVIVGRGEARTYSDAKKLELMVTKKRMTKFEDAAESRDKKDFFRIDKPTSLNGERLLIEPQADCLKDILYFVNARLVSKQGDFSWKNRASPLGK